MGKMFGKSTYKVKNIKKLYKKRTDKLTNFQINNEYIIYMLNIYF